MHIWSLSQSWRWLGLILAVVALGLVVRFAATALLGDPLSDFLGGVLYTVLIAVLVYPVAVILFRRRMPASPHAVRTCYWIAAAVALAVSVAIELLQLSSIPSQLSQLFPPARLVLGMSFAPIDLVACCVGALLVGVVGVFVERGARRG